MPVSSLTGRWWFGVLALVAPSLGGLNIIVANGYMDGRFVGNFTSQIAVAVLPMFPPVTTTDWVSGTTCRPQYPAVTVRCLPLHCATRTALVVSTPSSLVSPYHPPLSPSGKRWTISFSSLCRVTQISIVVGGAHCRGHLLCASDFATGPHVLARPVPSERSPVLWRRPCVRFTIPHHIGRVEKH